MTEAQPSSQAEDTIPAMVPGRFRRVFLVAAALIAIRLVVHAVVYRDAIAVAEILALDGCALVLLAIASLFGVYFGRGFASVTVFAVGVGLPLAGMGWALEVLDSAHLSEMVGFVGLVGIGCGLATAGPYHALLGLALAGGGAYGLTQIHDLVESLMIAAPYTVCFVLGVMVRMQTGASPAAKAAEAPI